MKHVKERYLLDCTVWGVSAALFATIGVSFLLLGPTNYKAEDLGKRWQQALSYVYVAACVAVILANANAVLVASSTYALSSLTPERRFIEWLARKTQSGLGRNTSVWVLGGAVCMLGCIVLSATLLHGWPMGVLAAGVAVLLYVLGQYACAAIFSTFVQMSEEEESPDHKEALGWFERSLLVVKQSIGLPTSANTQGRT
ncbi:hypothetical protein HXX76_001162 [Chlamydomonas incerta]|uniref:Uncharacterized protein n=1 Tax=Chlamydomonas incerta TaxID=51695 RepID=A0A835WBQ1_CHLIN|nr:hypothetical protein HXX76_001162 [Chlamydomonas incerta]|eukprot:KAG2444409.1 hypothetical protein HXX76_001162 [Chlamydomonas incerta]